MFIVLTCMVCDINTFDFLYILSTFKYLRGEFLIYYILCNILVVDFNKLGIGDSFILIYRTSEASPGYLM